MSEYQAAPQSDPIHEYIQNRVEQYRGWYDKKSGQMKSIYLRMKGTIVVGSAIVPVLVNLDWNYAAAAATLVSILTVVLVSLESVYHYGEQWKNYRSTEQFLGQETILFRTRVGRYASLDEEAAFKRFVERVENAIAQENAVTLDVLTRETTITQTSEDN